MPVDNKILALLVCPENHQPLQMASAEVIANANNRIHAGELRTYAGQPVREALSEALVREDGSCLYRVDDGIPNLLVEDRIELK